MAIRSVLLGFCPRLTDVDSPWKPALRAVKTDDRFELQFLAKLDDLTLKIAFSAINRCETLEDVVEMFSAPMTGFTVLEIEEE